ncbi:hypothetical protein AC249_AIPGENE11561 [Exaiptasia diaphana]|nr:hypothetical protein AC249_AIPGENE11561 [Exaiptasia diaphana]
MCTFIAKNSSMSKEKWRPGREDVECFIEWDPTGVYIGELNGKPIGFVYMIKLHPTCCNFRCFFIEKTYRGNGYGIEMFKIATKDLSPSQNIIAYSMTDMVQKYKNRFGFQDYWIAPVFSINLSSALKKLSQFQTNSNSLVVKTFKEIDFKALRDYDAVMFGYQREAFLNRFLITLGTHARVAVSSDGTIVGYVVSRATYDTNDGYRLGPFYANSLDIAIALLKALLKDIPTQESSLILDVPTSRNPDAKRLVEILDGAHLFDTTFIATKGIPNGHIEHCFALVAP